MNLAFFIMPIHPACRDWRQTLEEDRTAFILADELGYSEAYCGEHITDACENITSPPIFLASLAHATKQIRLGTGTINLPNAHPARVAAEVAMLDHLLGGRFIFGVGPGGLLSDAEIFGNIDADRNAMFVEAIDHVLAIWTRDPPYDLEGKYWRLSTRRQYWRDIGQGVIGKPLQRPHPPIVVTVVAPFSKGVVEAAARGWQPLTANFLLPQWVKTHWPKYVEGCQRAGRVAEPAAWRIAKNIFVAEDNATAYKYVFGAKSPYRHYYDNLLTKRRRYGLLEVYKADSSMPDDAITTDYVLSKLVIWGTPNKVAEELLSFRDDVGEFGTLVYVGHDWRDPDLARRSMILMAEKVMPIVNNATKR
jgi:alkanesulfonate monooxygenase SsuD/methylene tetrahydromethanopterin reductase-like flavin-dependent oxidoreductase (luciferase family)